MKILDATTEVGRCATERANARQKPEDFLLVTEVFLIGYEIKARNPAPSPEEFDREFQSKLSDEHRAAWQRYEALCEEELRRRVCQ